MSLAVTPKKSLGQNFLNSERVLGRITDAADLTPTDLILEIGPGLGALTEHLVALAGKVIAVEKDDTLYTILSEKFSQEIQDGRLDLIHKDILQFDPEIIRFYKDLDYSIIANIPYNITGQIFRKFLTASYQPQQMIVLIQKEVATRILAKDKKESLLSLSIKAYGTPKLVTHVARGNFTPAPNVDSSVIIIQDISRDRFKNSHIEDLFFKLIHAGFGHKRKMLAGNLRDSDLGNHDWEKILSEININPKIRAEDLLVTDWVRLAEKISTP